MLQERKRFTVKSYLTWKFTVSLPVLFEAHLVQWLSSSEMESVTRVQTLNAGVSISLRANALGKGVNPSVLSTITGK